MIAIPLQYNTTIPKFRTSDGTIWTDWTTGFLPLTGGTLSGGIIRIEADGCYTEVHQHNKEVYIRSTDGSGNNYADIMVGINSPPTYITMKDGVYNGYIIYGTHNVKSGTSSAPSDLQNNGIYLKYS